LRGGGLFSLAAENLRPLLILALSCTARPSLGKADGTLRVATTPAKTSPGLRGSRLGPDESIPVAKAMIHQFQAVFSGA
jgi:hypothetical protein